MKSGTKLCAWPNFRPVFVLSLGWGLRKIEETLAHRAEISTRPLRSRGESEPSTVESRVRGSCTPPWLRRRKHKKKPLSRFSGNWSFLPSIWGRHFCRSCLGCFQVGCLWSAGTVPDRHRHRHRCSSCQSRKGTRAESKPLTDSCNQFSHAEVLGRSINPKSLYKRRTFTCHPPPFPHDSQFPTRMTAKWVHYPKRHARRRLASGNKTKEGLVSGEDVQRWGKRSI
ncbi:hypothetical protein B0T24DRAFT_401715 [Lasiosphaeria ovina]|uniref:Uncharacterized protein n=1 Tax=Lasiosphaeria ovina TaxID=92902 RepID=A0AAE0JXK3_9PEZI|nr:hypothetical protein B0T24DRAFT_401715 [Lasiosphaeria ovina]